MNSENMDTRPTGEAIARPYGGTEPIERSMDGMRMDAERQEYGMVMDASGVWPDSAAAVMPSDTMATDAMAADKDEVWRKASIYVFVGAVVLFAFTGVWVIFAVMLAAYLQSVVYSPDHVPAVAGVMVFSCLAFLSARTGVVALAVAAVCRIVYWVKCRMR